MDNKKKKIFRLNGVAYAKPPVSDVDFWEKYKEENGIVDCPECEGTGETEVIDTDRINSQTITPPYKKITCENCEGVGEVVKEGVKSDG